MQCCVRHRPAGQPSDLRHKSLRRPGTRFPFSLLSLRYCASLPPLALRRDPLPFRSYTNVLAHCRVTLVLRISGCLQQDHPGKLLENFSWHAQGTGRILAGQPDGMLRRTGHVQLHMG
ncbi:putative Lipoprotein [Pseudomonas amygdali pv. hibisci]|uniref:Lipoprotein n=1 Tax=Pseudomonas amygdali pv. hibisci TaxID=251723 RepID=A0AB34U7E6_PSEA0|nr:putative Lipoprotein [Pseudomonas amygdali pv. hibisci]